MPDLRTMFDQLTQSESELPTIDLRRDRLPSPLRASSPLGVLDVTEWFGTTSGGIRTYLLQKAQYVAAHPTLRQILVVPGARDTLTGQDGVRLYRLQGPPIPRQPPYRFLLSARRVATIVRHERPDIIEIGSSFVVPWIVRQATRRVDVPLVCFYHSNLPRLFAPTANAHSVARRSIYRAAWQYMRQLDHMLSLTIVTSAFAANDLAREGITRIAKVPLGVDLDRFHPQRRAHASDTRRRFGIPPGLVAGFVGRFAREKDLDIVLDAWETIERRTGAHLVLVGTGPLEHALRAHRYGSRVTFVPFQSDRDAVADLLASFDVSLAPGRIETFGLSALEALASGTPVLSADEGGVSEQVTASGAGRTFASGEVESLATEAERLFASDLLMLGRNGRAYAEAEHAWDRVFDRLFAVYRDVLTTHARR